METAQVGKEAYAIGSYGFEGRFVSYFHQLKLVLGRNPDTVLEIGVGDRVFGDFIKNNTDVRYTSLDIAEDLSPDILASVTDIPLEDDSSDVACAFEVLEHLPFEKFERAVSELARVANDAVVVSLPHFGPMLSLSFKIPFIKEVRMAVKLPFPKTHAFNGQHYWEIGKSGYPLARIREVLRRYGTLEEDYIPFNSPYHHFFVLRLPRS
jgi:hypothetical protein